jgi:hypothetical protein
MTNPFRHGTLPFLPHFSREKLPPVKFSYTKPESIRHAKDILDYKFSQGKTRFNIYDLDDPQDVIFNNRWANTLPPLDEHDLFVDILDQLADKYGFDLIQEPGEYPYTYKAKRKEFSYNNPESISLAKDILRDHFNGGKNDFSIYDLSNTPISFYFYNRWLDTLPSQEEHNLFLDLLAEVSNEYNVDLEESDEYPYPPSYVVRQ